MALSVFTNIVRIQKEINKKGTKYSKNKQKIN